MFVQKCDRYCDQQEHDRRGKKDAWGGDVTVVSSSYHMYRAKQYAKMLGVEVAGFPGKPDYPITTLNYYIREAFGVTYLWVLGK